MTYRTKTYIAGDWTGDSDAIKNYTNGMKAIIGVCRL